MLERISSASRGTVSLRWGATVVLGTAAVILSIVSLGLPGTVILAGGWLLALGLGRRVPGLDGPVSWAGAVIVEVAVLTLDTLVLKRLAPHQHGSIANLAALAGPAILGLALALPWPRRRPRSATADRDGAPEEPTREAPVRTPARPLVALTVLAAGLLVPLWIASHGLNYRIAWTMGGDARNHALIARSLLENGGLSLRVLKIYPALIDSITSLIAGAGHRGGLRPGQLLLHDAKALMTTYVLAGIAISTMTVAALLEALPRAVAVSRRLPAAAVVLILSSAGISVSALLLTTTVRDGFISAYGTVPIAIAGTVAALRCCSRPSPASFALIGPAGVLAFLGFTTLAVVPLALVVAVTVALVWSSRAAWRGGGLLAAARSRNGIAWLLATAATWGSVLVCAGVTYAFRDTLHRQFLLPGSITGSQSRMLYLLGFVAVLVGTLAWRGGDRRQALVPIAATVVSGLTVKFLISLSPDGHTWTYYAAKTLYLLVGSVLWIAFLPALRSVTVDGRAGTAGTAGRLESGLRAVQAVAAALVVYIVLGWTTTLTSPLSLAADGWSQPSAPVVTEVAKIADRGQPFLLWEWTDPGNERLGAFWASLAWAYNANWSPKSYPGAMSQGVPNWAYFESGQVKDLCTVARGVNGLYVITSNPKFKANFARVCPASGAHVVVDTG